MDTLVQFFPDGRDWVKLDNYQRYQRALSVCNLFPDLKNGLCGCGCGARLPKGKRRWASAACQYKAVNTFLIIKGDTGAIRKALYERDQGACRSCGEITDTWEADHVIPVHHGGGACGMENFQTLCKSCHKEKTKTEI